MQIACIINSYASGSELDMVILSRAARGKPFSALAKLYHACHANSSSSSSSRQQDPLAALTPLPCCQASHIALSAMLHLGGSGGTGAALIRSEAFTSRPSHGSGCAHAGRRKVVVTPTDLLGAFVQGAQSALRHCRPCTVPQLDSDGSIKAYIKGKEPADPCWQRMEASSVVPSDGRSLVEKWIRLLEVAAVGGGKSAVRALYRRHATDILEEALEACACPKATTPGTSAGVDPLLDAIESAYGAFSVHSQVRLEWAATSKSKVKGFTLVLICIGLDPTCPPTHMRAHQFIAQDVCESKSPAALTGMAMRSNEPRLSLLALDRLVPLVDACTATEFIHLVARPGGVLTAVHQMALITASSQDCSQLKAAPAYSPACFCIAGGKEVLAHPWRVSVAAAMALVRRPDALRAPFPQEPEPILIPDFSAPQSGAIRDVACALLLTALDRARRMGGCKAMQVMAPRNEDERAASW